jgi:hypothetical protein
MGEVIRFIPKSERERARLIREARAIYDGIFPPSGTVSKDTAPLGHAVSGANAYRSAGFSFHDQDHRRALQSLLSGKLPRADVTTSDFADISMQSCLMGVPQLAEWMKQHPAERLAAWRCVIGKREGTGA